MEKKGRKFFGERGVAHRRQEIKEKCQSASPPVFDLGKSAKRNLGWESFPCLCRQKGRLAHLRFRKPARSSGGGFGKRRECRRSFFPFKRLLAETRISRCKVMWIQQTGTEIFENTPKNRRPDSTSKTNFAPDWPPPTSLPPGNKQKFPILPPLRKKDAFPRAKEESRSQEPARQ